MARRQNLDGKNLASVGLFSVVFFLSNIFVGIPTEIVFLKGKPCEGFKPTALTLFLVVVVVEEIQEVRRCYNKEGETNTIHEMEPAVAV